MMEFSETGNTRRNILPNLIEGSIDLFGLNSGVTRAFWRNDSAHEYFVCVSGLAVLVYFRGREIGAGTDTHREVIHPYLNYSVRISPGYFIGVKAFSDNTLVLRYTENPDELVTLPWDYLGPEIWDAVEERI